jgi:predicted TIM-barrel fold metal-dependent hydrolase
LDSILTVHAFTHPVGAMLAVTCFTVGGILERHPGLRVGFMEAGVGWLPFWLERLDEHWEHVPDQAPAIDRAPSTYFFESCFLGCEPDERMLPYVMRELAPDAVCYASDYCHWDCAFPDTVRILDERSDLDDEHKTKVLASNAARLYGLPIPAAVS